MVETYIKYINDLDLAQEFKDILADRKFIDRNPIFYLYYPRLFCNAFGIGEDDVELLSIAGFLFFRSVILIDEMVDNGKNSNLPLSLICQEESIKILASIFGLDSEFWTYWNKRRNEYFYAIKLEKSFFEKEEVKKEEYCKLADFKSTFGKAAIDALHIMSQKRHVEVYDKLLNSHTLFSIAFQIHDDILDFSKDFEKSQFNWANYKLCITEKKEKDKVRLNKLLYINGTAVSLFKDAIEYDNEAFDVISDLPDIQWKNILKERIRIYSQLIFQIERYLELIISEITLSQKKIVYNSPQKSLTKAVQFIKNKQNKDGSWREYVTQAGVSNLWATAFIITFLSEHKLKARFENEISEAIGFLQKNTIKKLWGFNTNCIEDADSSQFSFISLLLNHASLDDSIIEDWVHRFQSESGGFSTYHNTELLLSFLADPDITNVDGWCSPHFCVSTTSFYFLSLLPTPPKEVLIKLNYYIEKQIPLNGITAYWWTSSIYSTFFLVKAYLNFRQFDKVENCLKELANQQNKNGSFSDDFGENVFYTGLALRCFKESERYQENFKRGIQYLFKNQFADGSWENSYALRIPDPTVVPIKKDDIWPISAQGTSVRAKELNRLFTTSVILNVIS